MGMDAANAAAGLLEPSANSVTTLFPTAESGYEVGKHRCRCWFCSDCCYSMGIRLRRRLEPILETFSGLLMVTLTVDPSLFASPKEAYFYIRERRCIARTVQDLWRRGCLHSRRYFYVVEWQKRTEQAHFHVLLDASYIPWSFLLESWSKHRPETAGPVVPGRPAFGTVLISVAKFGGGAAHAARYATKYLTKVPEHGFPSWVLDLGQTTRVRRYSTSRGFWGEESEPPVTQRDKEMHPVSYRRRIATCAHSLDVYEIRDSVDYETGEIIVKRAWVGELAVDARTVLAAIHDEGPPKRSRRVLHVRSLPAVVTRISSAVGRPVEWLHGGHRRKDCEDTLPYDSDTEQRRRHERYDVDKEIARFVESQR